VTGVLSVLRAKNFILMDELELALEPGLNVLTGETGAGKSIVVGALGLVLGGRASADQVRPGADEAEIEALFEIDGATDAPELAPLVSAGLVTGREVAIRRVVSSSGRSRAYVNGRLCTAAELAALAPALADVASQHESVALTDPQTHLDHLDRFAELESERAALGAQVRELEALQESIRSLRTLEKTRAEREAFLRFQLRAIEDVDPHAGEVDALRAERQRLRHASRLRELVQRSAERLEVEDGLCDQLGRVASDLKAAAELDPALGDLASAVASCFAELGAAAATASRYLDAEVGDPGRLDAVEERLYRIEGLLRQHGPTEDDLLAARARLEAELAELTGSESKIEEEERLLAARLPAAQTRALALSDHRRRAAEKLGAAIGSELGGLGMGGARVLVEVEPLPAREEGQALSAGGARLSQTGIDRVEFLIAPNKGIEPKPLRKIASGGELSRALLALKRVLAGGAPARLYVFDEVDTGVGGAVAERIGAAIADVARHHQVLCITHLSQIAAFASAHFAVRKHSEDDVSKSDVVRLRGDDRVREVARMLSGSKITATAIAAAAEMIEASKPATRKNEPGGRPTAKAATARPAPPKAKPSSGKPRYS
jgi:DNA repair protein RecN (Recombination protein N)